MHPSISKLSLQCALAATVLATVFAGMTAAPANATQLARFVDVERTGLSVQSASVGLRGLGNGVASLQIATPANVSFAVLYWSGQDRTCPRGGPGCVIPAQPYKDQQLAFDGKPVTGTIIGTEEQPASADGAANNIAYKADVTALVNGEGAGPHSFPLADGNLSSNLATLDGASLIIGYIDPNVTEARRLIVFEGLDFALGNDATAGASRTTAPVVFDHGAQAFARTAELSLAVGGASDAGADRISISGNPTFLNCLDASSRSSWDNESIAVSIPAGVATTSVHATSPADAPNPDYLNWVAATLLVSDGTRSVPAADSCPTPAPEPEPAPAPADGASPAQFTPAPDSDAPVLSGLRVGPRAAARTRVRYALSEAAKVRFVVERRKGGRFVRVRRPFVLSGARGLNVFRLRQRVRKLALLPGRYRLRAVATDGAGNRSRPARTRFRLLR